MTINICNNYSSEMEIFIHRKYTVDPAKKRDCHTVLLTSLHIIIQHTILGTQNLVSLYIVAIQFEPGRSLRTVNLFIIRDKACEFLHTLPMQLVYSESMAHVYIHICMSMPLIL